MTCEHLQPIMKLAEDAGVAVTAKGRLWGGAAGEWIYYDCRFDAGAVVAAIALPGFVHWHEHRGTHDGSEAGFVCDTCETGVMGLHPTDTRSARTLPEQEAPSLQR